MSQVVDTESAKEFMKEALSKISPEELTEICSQLEIKSQIFQKQLSLKSLSASSEEDFLKILRLIFSTRRKAPKILKELNAVKLKQWTVELLYGNGKIESRFQMFCDYLEGLESNVRYDLASELLHFTFPGQYWLWTRWMWDPKPQTGALTLVTTEDYDLNSASLGETYLKVGEAVAFVHQVGAAAGFQTISRSLFGTDVYLSCVYVVYVYTVLRIRMTQEFNKVIPGLPEFSRRLLGVHKLEGA
ncbi:MAG: hypothetical protein ACE5IR_04265 [bacterium]